MNCAFVLDYPKETEVYLFDTKETNLEAILKSIYDKIASWISKNGSDVFKYIIGPRLCIESEFPDFKKQDDCMIPKNTVYIFTVNEQPRILTWIPIDRTEHQYYNQTGEYLNKIIMVTRLPKG